MKFKKSIIIFIVLLIIVVIAVMNNISANNEDTEKYVPRDRTSVILVKDENDEKLIHVRLGMKEDASVASFQIGLDLDITNDANVEFTWNENLNQEKFKEYRYNEPSNDTSDRLEKRLNLYYVGTQELNDGKNDELDIGTIKITENKEATVKISPDAEFTTVATIGHKTTELEIKEEDTLNYIMNDENKENSGDNTSENPGNAGETGDSGETGDASDSDNTSGSGADSGEQGNGEGGTGNEGGSQSSGTQQDSNGAGNSGNQEGQNASQDQVQDENKEKDKGNGILPKLYPKTGIVWLDNILAIVETVLIIGIVLAIIRRRNRRKLRRRKH